MACRPRRCPNIQIPITGDHHDRFHGGGPSSRPRDTGPPEHLIDRLDAALASTARTKLFAARVAQGIEITALRRRLAQLFAEQHGWKHSHARFSTAVLARRGMWDGHGRGLETWPYRLIDHPYFFRTPDRRAAALAAHLYGASADTREEAAARAAQDHLRVVFPTDFPSWWVPGGTTLCVYLPAEEERMSVNE